MIKKHEKLRQSIEKLCLDTIQKQKDRESKLGYGLDDYTEGRIVGAAALARKILNIIRSDK
jgi:hypothetical protein